MDDSTVLIESESPEALFTTLRAVIALVRAVFASYGFRINFGRGKTEIVARLAGRAAASAWQESVEVVDGCPVLKCEDVINC
eukprot:9808493-Alexandrium_andersonii.AAC.1